MSRHSKRRLSPPSCASACYYYSLLMYFNDGQLYKFKYRYRNITNLFNKEVEKKCQNINERFFKLLFLSFVYFLPNTKTNLIIKFDIFVRRIIPKRY